MIFVSTGRITSARVCTTLVIASSNKGLSRSADIVDEVGTLLDVDDMEVAAACCMGRLCNAMSAQ
eukprot:4950577-Amphidinium_carterae.1